MSPHGDNVLVRCTRGVTIAAFSRPDIIDLDYINTVADELDDLARTIDPPLLVIDFERVRYLSSAALGMLLALSEQLTARGGRLCVANVVEEVKGVFTLTKLPKIIETYGTTREAVGHLTR